MSGLAHPSDRNTPGPEATQNSHLLAIDTALGKDALLLTSLDGVDAVSRGFVYTVEMLTVASEDKVRGLLGRPVTLWLRNDSETERRPLHGYIRHLTRLAANARGYRTWRAEVVPFMWFLTRSVDCRIYQDLTIPEIIRSVFTDHELLHYELRLHEQYPKLVFCVQYRESAFAFVSRLMEHAGISYWFEHHEDRHVLVLADANRVAKFTEPREAMVSLRPDLGQIQDLVHDFSFRTGAWAMNDFDFEVPTKNLRSHEPTVLDIGPMKRYETFDYPGSYTGPEEGKRLTRLRIQEEEARHHHVSGSGSCVGFDAGRRFTLTPDRRSVEEDKPASYLLTEVRHSARDSNYLSTTSEPATYSNRFVCIPVETPFRAERLTPKPIVQGPQTATVVGPAGENIHTDQYGRVRLLFHWDRRGKRDEHASCWIRVSQAAAGSHWGGLAIPHVGQEVIVAFLEGDPDRPIVTGHVHNGDNMPPVILPRDKNKTILRDHGDNRIIMHGKAGQEHLTLVSPHAVNMVAARRPAKALSADITLDSNGIEGADSFIDGPALSELNSLWQGLDPPPGGKGPSDPDTKSSIQVPDGYSDSVSTTDINTIAEGKINSLSAGNTNTWVGDKSNTWIKGDMNQEVMGSTETKSHGTVTNTYKTSVRDTIDVAHEEETTLHNEFTLVHHELTGLHLEENVGLHTEFHVGWHIEGHLPDSGHIDLNETISIEKLDSKVSDISTDVKKIQTQIENIGTIVKTVGLLQIECRNYVINAHSFNATLDVMAVTSPTISLTAATACTLNGAQIMVG